MNFTNHKGNLFSAKNDYRSNKYITKGREYAPFTDKGKELNVSYFSYGIIKELQNKKMGCNSCNGAR